MNQETSYAKKHFQLYAALKQGDFKVAKDMLHNENQTFERFIDDYICQHGLVRQTVLRRADIPVAVGYKYLTGAKRTRNRNTILRLCIAMEMPIEDVQTALSLYGMNTLGDNDRDNIVRVGVEYRSTVDDIDEWLRGLSMEPLMDSYDR